MRRKVAIPVHAGLFIGAGVLYYFFVLPRWQELMGDSSHGVGTTLRIVTGALIALAALPVVFTLLRTRRPELGTPALALSFRTWSVVGHVLAGALIIGTAISEIWVSVDNAGQVLFGIYGAAAAIAVLAFFAFYLSFVAELPPPPPKPIKPKKPRGAKQRRLGRGKKDDEAEDSDEIEDADEVEDAEDIEAAEASEADEAEESETAEAATVEAAAPKTEEAKTVEAKLPKTEEAKTVAAKLPKTEEAKTVEAKLPKTEEAKTVEAKLPKTVQAKKTVQVKRPAPAKAVKEVKAVKEEAPENLETVEAAIPTSEPEPKDAGLRNRRPSGKASHRLPRKRTRGGVTLDEKPDE
jgi:hypothetical protein